MWTCPGCQAKVDGEFEICWRCGTSPEGEEDPYFGHEGDSDSYFRASVKPDPKVQKTDDSELAESWEASTEPWNDIVECYWARNCNEAMVLANHLELEGIPARADSIDLRIVMAGLFGLISAGPYFAPRVWILARDLPRARDWLADYEERRRGKRKGAE